ncbi:MAG: hypothetical protein HUK08_04255 [Bacteroidaceae bacterium]|nr:hypothetical protein [Bacteroidaceae bacterium]
MLLLLSAILTCCTNEHQKRREQTVRSMYYWSTVFRIDSAKAEFMEAHKVEKIYVRYFDVVNNDNNENVPNATIQFDSAVACNQEIIPTVFIHNECMRSNDTLLADRLLKRILQMNETHHIGKVREIQIDCDWTLSTRKQFYSFMASFREKLHKEGITLSSTIRLHQLSQPAPPADKGVLMAYNTGDFRKLSVEKPILDIRDVLPYLKNLADYDLPVATAFPIYKWDLLFRNGKYIGIMHEKDELPMLNGDTIVQRQPTIDDILSCKKALLNTRPDCMDEIILFDLNNYNINRYNQKDYEKIFD